MPAFDFDSARRWARFGSEGTLSRRGDARLPLLDRQELAGPTLLLDTCVYIDQIQGRTPQAVDRLLEIRQSKHSTIAIQELMHTVGVLNPRDARTKSAVNKIRGQILAMPPHRIFAPDPDVLGRASLLAGILCRLQGYAKDDRLRALHDCVLFLQAQKLGLIVLTGNVADFDFLLQLIPTGRVLMYRQERR